ncbi:DUF6092 family protein [Oscillospiraceae bacterium LTW-04]|nr:DUF6092 family protein [Oscillospiraceae bacterium MB24-C1]
MSEQEHQACLELLVYMLISAAALGDEPKIYGPLRLAEASRRLGQIMLNCDPGNRSLRELVAIIEDGKHKSMSDEAGFYAMLQDAVIKLVDLM